MKETRGFQAEVKQLLHLMVHSLYSNKEIFLRELVSNASDACDKLRFEAIGKPELLAEGVDFTIRIALDPAARSITISDNGVGMSRDEAIEHLGTIAKSGTREFFSALTGDQQKDAQLIGQFGVGFYSSFIVAERVSVLTRRAGADAAVRWASDGSGEFTIEPAVRASRGTDVTLTLKAGEEEFASGHRVRAILRKYSDHIATPIRMKTEVWDKDKGAQVATDEDETVNQASALWARPKGDISDEQYREFYKHAAHDLTDPLAWTHNRVEGRQEYIQLLYLPARAPFDLWDRKARHGVKLYVRRVFIMDDAGALLPAYLRFASTAGEGAAAPLASVSLTEYLSRLKEGQKAIYYATADSLEAARNSPHLEIFRKKGVEVLLLADRVDEWMLSFLHEFEGKSLVSVAKGDLDLGELADAADKEAREKVAEEFKDLVARVKAALGDAVSDVRVTLRLTDSPACVVVESDAMSRHLQRMLKGAGQKMSETKPILELDPQHPLVARLKEASEEGVKDWALLLLEQATLAEGAPLEGPAAFVRRVNRMLAQAKVSR